MNWMNSGYTCITCHLIFANNDVQKAHYQTDWHRYNLKRQAVQMPPIAQEEYDAKVAQFAAKPQTAAAPTVALYCATCNKTFQTENAYDSHQRSKKHLEEAKRTTKKGPKQPRKKPSITSTTTEEKMEVEEKEEEDGEKKKIEEEVEEEEDEEDTNSEDWHTADEDEDEEEEEDLREAEALPVTSCLFCPQTTSSLDANLQHMAKLHDFSIPDAAFCPGVNALIEYLGLKVGAGRMCIYCPERRASFATVDACQKHMRDKQHCRIQRDAEAMIELADYYDYDALYEDMQANGTGEVEDEGWTLTLPSGAKIGHRSLLRFYKQNLKTVESQSGKSRAAIDKARGMYAALAWTGCTGTVALKAAKDMKYMQRVRRRFELRVGLKSNKLFMSRGRSDQ